MDSFKQSQMFPCGSSYKIYDLEEPVGAVVKESNCRVGGAGDMGSIPGLGRSPGERNGNPLQYSCLGSPMDRSLVGYSPWSRKRVGHSLVTKQHEYRDVSS